MLDFSLNTLIGLSLTVDPMYIISPLDGRVLVVHVVGLGDLVVCGHRLQTLCPDPLELQHEVTIVEVLLYRPFN